LFAYVFAVAKFLRKERRRWTN